MLTRLIVSSVTRRVFNRSVASKFYCSKVAMSGKESYRGVPLEKVVEKLEEFAGLGLAASWDNVGLLVEPTENAIVQRIMLTNDLTENVVKEVLDERADMIVTYHPLIFSPLKSVTRRSWKERIVAKCLENKIAVYSPHTCFDSVKGGVNDWLARAFDTETCTPIQADENNPVNGMGRLCTLKTPILIEEAVRLVKRHTGLEHVRLARAVQTDGLVRCVALCAGSGVSVLKGVSADLYLTGEMLHHDILDAVHTGANVMLLNHSDSERGFLKEFAGTLHDLLQKDVDVCVSRVDADPLKTV